eukprot:UN00677
MPIHYILSVFALSIYITFSVEITGWIYVDNWFELYFNGEKVATDPITFKPHNAVKISFTAPDTGLYSYAIWAQDFADDVTGLEERNGGTCLGDGGIRIKLSDGTISSTDWKCFIVMEGPYVINDCSYSNECTNDPDACTVTYNDYPSCWNQTTCVAADSWSSATTYDNVDGWGVPTENEQCCGVQTTYTQAEIDACAAIYPTGCNPGQFDWGAAEFMWTGDLNLHNRLICRYEYCVGGGTECMAQSVPRCITYD